jgi:hypothetical protein
MKSLTGVRGKENIKASNAPTSKFFLLPKRRHADDEGQAQNLETETSSPGLDAVSAPMHRNGEPLDDNTHSFFQKRFGFDFSAVRIHADSQAADSARSINALAYTVGRDVVFAASQYSPHTDRGRELLAHELAHVIQQRRASAGLAPASSSLEREAESASKAILSGHTIPAMQQVDRATLAKAPQTPEEKAAAAAKELRDALEEQARLPNEWLDAKISLDANQVELDNAKSRLEEIEKPNDFEKINEDPRQRRTERRELRRTIDKKTEKVKKSQAALEAVNAKMAGSAKKVQTLAREAEKLGVDVGQVVANLSPDPLFGDELADKLENLEKGGGTHGGGGRTGGGVAGAAGGAAPSGKAGKSAASRITKALTGSADKALKIVPFLGFAAGAYSLQDNLRKGEYFEAFLDAVGFIPIVGDVLDAVRFLLTFGGGPVKPTNRTYYLSSPDAQVPTTRAIGAPTIWEKPQHGGTHMTQSGQEFYR